MNTLASRRFRAVVAAVAGLAVVLAACGDADDGSADDALSGDAAPDVALPAEDVEDLDATIDSPADEPQPGEGVSERLAAWTVLSDEYLAGVADDERAVSAGIDLLPPGMPLPDLSYLGTVGVSIVPECVSAFSISVGMYELNAQGQPVAYEFSRAEAMMETGFNAAGWQVIDAIDLYPDGHPVDSEGRGTHYLVDADGEYWRIWIYSYLSAASAEYCPAS